MSQFSVVLSGDERDLEVASSFIDKNWFTSNNSPPELKVFFSGENIITFLEKKYKIFIKLNFIGSSIDWLWYALFVLTFFLTGFKVGLFALICLVIALFFSFTRTSLFWFIFFVLGLKKKGYKGRFLEVRLFGTTRGI